jgi:hemin uptake protein HemP
MKQPIPEVDRRSVGDNVSKSEPAARSIAVIDDRIDSRDVFVATREVIIAHGTDHYRLRLTSQNKLILTK